MVENNDSDHGFDAPVVEAVRELRGEMAVTPHPDIDELVAYQEGHLEGEAAERVRHHLVACSRCAREMLQLEILDQEPGEGWEPDDAEVEADFQALRRRIAEAEAEEAAGSAPSPVVPIVAAPARPIRPAAPATPFAGRRHRDPWRLVALAASALLAVVLLSVWWTGVFGPGGDRRAPSNPFLFDLAPEGAADVRSADTAPTIEVPADLDPLVARLLLGDQTPYDSYQVTALDARGKLLLRLDELSRQPNGSFLATLPRSSFPPGVYRLTLTGVLDGETTELATYAFRITDSRDR